MSECISKKVRYPAEREAEEALIAAWVKFNNNHGGGPVAVYRCDDCGDYHLTSKGEMNDRLKKMIDDKKIERLREASHWESKLKGNR